MLCPCVAIEAHQRCKKSPGGSHRGFFVAGTIVDCLKSEEVQFLGQLAVPCDGGRRLMGGYRIVAPMVVGSNPLDHPNAAVAELVDAPA